MDKIKPQHIYSQTCVQQSPLGNGNVIVIYKVVTEPLCSLGLTVYVAQG